MKNIASRRFRKIDFHNHIWLPDDPVGDKLIEAMDEYGIERMLLQGSDRGIWSYCGGDDDLVRAVRKHPKRFIGAVHLDFRQGVRKCREKIRRYAGEGLKLAKMYPNLGFYPDAIEYDPIYVELAKHRMFAAYHMGYLATSDVNPRRTMSTKYSRPFFLEEVAIRHPELDFVICHMGGVPGYEETLCVTRFYPNIYADLAPGYGIEAFRLMHDKIGLVEFDKFMYGPDSHRESWDRKFKFWAENAAALGYEDKLKALFYDNAARFLAKYA